MKLILTWSWHCFFRWISVLSRGRAGALAQEAPAERCQYRAFMA
jgi:hypothetical protein